MNAASLTFEDLRGTGARGYIRDSNLDQRDGFGPDLQRANIRRFADTYGLVLDDQMYTEFVSGRDASKRREFQQIIKDARQDQFEVLLVDHTSRFGRNQEESIRYKSELQRLGKIIVFVSQGIISGTDRDFLNERINETLDEQYSRNLSRYVRAGFAEKAAQGYALGRAPLGYRTIKSASGRGAEHVPNDETLPTLITLLGAHASGRHSYGSLAHHLNALGLRTNRGLPFTVSSISNVLSNRFYEGKVIFHRGREDEQVIDGVHEVPTEVSDLWRQCQDVRDTRRNPGRPSPAVRQHRVYPLTGVLVCDGCGRPFHGHATRVKGGLYPRMEHHWHRCGAESMSISAQRIEREFVERVLAHINLDDNWHEAVIRAMANEGPEPDRSLELSRIESALGNLRKQHLWSAIDDAEFRSMRADQEKEKRSIEAKRHAVATPNLDRTAKLLMDLPALWRHQGVSGEQRREMAGEVFEEVRMKEGTLVSVKPRPRYAPLLAYSLTISGFAGGEPSSWVDGMNRPD